MDSITRFFGISSSEPPATKKPNSTISLGTIVRGLRAPDGIDPVNYGVDHYNDTFRIRPTDKEGVQQLEAQMVAKTPELIAVYTVLADNLSWELGDKIACQVVINSQPKSLSLSFYSNSIEFEIDGESESLYSTREDLEKKLADYLPKENPDFYIEPYDESHLDQLKAQSSGIKFDPNSAEYQGNEPDVMITNSKFFWD
jgi:hypothetical protein